VTVIGKLQGERKVPPNSNQVKSKQSGTHADGGGLYLVVRESGERVWAFRFTGLDGKRAQMEFAKVGDRDSEAGDVLTLSSARDKAREYKVALKRDGVDPRVKKRVSMHGGKTFKKFAEEQYPLWCKSSLAPMAPLLSLGATRRAVRRTREIGIGKALRCAA
jgi:hypothetical protein